MFCRGDSWIIYLFLGRRHNSHPKHYLSLAIKLNLCYNKSAQQKGITRQTVTVRTQGSSGTPVISAAEFTFTQGPWLSPKDSEPSEWHEAAPLPQNNNNKKPVYLTVTFTISQPQQNPSTMAASFLASREDDEMLHEWPLCTEASPGRGSSTKHWPCTTDTSRGQTQTLTDGFWGTITDILSRQFLVNTLGNKGSDKQPFHKRDPGRVELFTKVC